VLTITEIAGFAGAGLAGAAYVPQVSHLIRVRCSAGISRLAFVLWLLASILITARAVAIHAGVFITLGGIQIVATALIMFYATRYKDTPCPVHVPRQPMAKAGPGRAAQVTSPVPGAPPAARTLRAHVPVLHRHSGAVTARSGREAAAQATRSRRRR
jgi:uncharacterized protein with PQ loop repeat